MSSAASELVLFDAQLKEEKEYWLQRLAGKANVANLPADYEEPKTAAGERGSVSICIDGGLYSRIARLTNGSPFLTYTALMAALKVCLRRYSGGEIVIVGSAALKELERPNALPIVDVVDDQTSFRQLLAGVRETLLEGYRSQRYPYEYMLRDQGLDGTENRRPFFEVALAMSGLHGGFPDLKNDLTITFDDRRDGLSACLDFNKRRWRQDTIKRFAGYYLNLLRDALDRVDAPLSALDMLAVSEQHQIVVEWNDTAGESPAGAVCFLPLFAEQVEGQPDALAVVCEERHLTYDELNRRANQLSNYVRRLGVGPEVCVGICMERSPDIVIGLLAILKAGAAYVPIDPGYPRERMAFVIEDTQMPVLLSQYRLLNLLPDQGAKVICTDSCREEISREFDEDPPGPPYPDNLAYVLYTSGSTGSPKGVMIPHGGLGNYLSWSAEAYEMRAGRGAPVHSPIAFDLTITALLAPLTAGSTTFLISEEDALTSLSETMRRAPGMSLVKVTPSHLDALARLLGQDELQGWSRALVVGGEALLGQSLRPWRASTPGVRVINEYGPTEAVVGCCVYDMPLDDELKGAVPIGRPIANARIHLITPNLHPAAIGVTAELHIGGMGLARGYLNSPAITACSFIPNPFSDESGARLYSTGDLARQGSDGVIHFLGRRDHQVKIRGYRIELAEIETTLAQHPSVREAVAVAREDKDQPKKLIAYLVSGAPQAPSAEELKEFLMRRLPDYMIPTAFVLLDRLPLTDNGKVDRAALRESEHEGSDLKTTFLAPRTDIELTLANVWSQVLGIERIGVNDNFFDLGGDSILSIQIVARAGQAGLRLNPRQLFRYQTIAELAQVSERSRSLVDQGLVTGSAPLTPIQRWFFEQELSDPHHFNQAIILEVHRPLGAGVVKGAVSSVLRWHDALRLRFMRQDGTWTQTESGPDEADPFLALDLSALPDADQIAVIGAAAARLQTTLDLAAGPLLRIALFETGANSPARLLFIVHHLVIDGVSWRILLEDFQTACEQLVNGRPVDLPAKTTSYQQWARRLEEYAKAPDLRQEADYWLAEGRTTVAPLPVAYPDGVNTVKSSRVITVTLSADETWLLLHQMPQFYRTHINEVLLTALAETFARWTGLASLRIDLEGHGREDLFDDLDLSRTVGWFTASFPVLLDLRDSPDIGAKLRAVKEQLRGVPNRGIGYGLLRYLSHDRNIRERLGAIPTAQVSFNYFGQFDQALSETSLVAPARESTGPSRSLLGNRGYLLDISGMVAGGQLRMNWMYSENAHRRSTIQELANGFVESLRSLITGRESIGTASYVASDFPIAGLGPGELHEVLSAAGYDRRIDDIYPLSPLQEGLLFHSLYVPHSGVYIAQMVFELDQLNFHAFKQAWQRVLEQQPVFRTAFAWKNIEKPVQVVVGMVQLEVEYADLRELFPDQQQRRLDSYLEADRNRPFDFTKPPLMRLALFRTNDSAYRFVWTHHHLLLDGWSMSLVAKDFFSLYESFSLGQACKTEAARPYRDFIAFLRDQDMGAAEAYWRGALKGLSVPSVFEGNQTPAGSSRHGDSHAVHRLRATASATQAMQSWGRRHRLTINTLVQAAWALVLGNCLGREDVLFGNVVSGRPASMTGIESMVGLFINTLPVRVRLTPEAMLVPWLEGIQQQQVEILQYEYTPLVQAHQWSDLPKGSPLFDSIVIVENYPVEFAIASQKQVLGVRFSGIFERLNFPLTISIEPGSELSIKIIYDSARFSETTIDRIGRQIRAVLNAFAEQDVTTLSSLQEMLRGNESDELRLKRTKLATTLRTVKRKPVRDSSTGTD